MEGLIFGILRYAVLWGEKNKLNSILYKFFLCFGYSVFIGVIILLLKDS